VDRRRPAGAPTIIVVESGSCVFRRRVSNIVVHRSCNAAPSRQLQDWDLTIAVSLMAVAAQKRLVDVSEDEIEK
jgi:hypothetical protein